MSLKRQSALVDFPDQLKELIDAHWNYVGTLLRAHGNNESVIKACEFHYKTAFEHGYKHALEDQKIDKQEWRPLGDLLQEAIAEQRANSFLTSRWGE